MCLILLDAVKDKRQATDKSSVVEPGLFYVEPEPKFEDIFLRLLLKRLKKNSKGTSNLANIKQNPFLNLFLFL